MFVLSVNVAVPIYSAVLLEGRFEADLFGRKGLIGINDPITKTHLFLILADSP